MESPQSHPISVFIWGSCVSRETFAWLGDGFKLSQHVARPFAISAVSDTSGPTPGPSPLASAAQDCVAGGAQPGGLIRQLEAHTTEIDLVLMDLIDERGGVKCLDDSHATKLSENVSTSGHDPSTSRDQKSFGTETHFTLWKNGAERFIELLDTRGLRNRTVVISPAPISNLDAREPLGASEELISSDSADISTSRYYSYLRSAGLEVIELPPELARSSTSHHSDPQSFHHSDAAHAYLASRIASFAHRTTSTPQARIEPDLGYRNLQTWGEFADYGPAAISGALPTGTHRMTFWRDGWPVDILVEHCGAPTTLVSLHAALGSTGLIPPVFTGRSVTDLPGANRIFISDPSLLASRELSLAWYLGAAGFSATDALSEIICQLITALGSKHLVFFGMSGGGFAALNLAHEFPGSLALPVNPQTRVLDYGPPHWSATARHCFGSVDEDSARDLFEQHPRADLRRLYAEGSENAVLYVQNRNDGHVSTQMIPWFETLGWDNGGALLLGDWGMGHRPPPLSDLKELLTLVASSQGDWDQLINLAGAERHPTRQWVRKMTGR